MGHGKQQQCINFIRESNETRSWKDVKIMVFDAPQATDKPYSQRLELLEKSTYYSLLCSDFILKLFHNTIQFCP
jgi:hypothetical protein